MDRIEQSLRVALRAPPATSPECGERPLGTPLAPRCVPSFVRPGDTLPDAEAVIFSILPILAILSAVAVCGCRLLLSRTPSGRRMSLGMRSCRGLPMSNVPFETAIVPVVASNSRNAVRNRRTPCLGRFRAGCEQPRCQRRQRGFQVTLRKPTTNASSYRFAFSNNVAYCP
jgi:hypothetical protein